MTDRSIPLVVGGDQVREEEIIPCVNCGATEPLDGDWYRLCGTCRWDDTLAELKRLRQRVETLEAERAQAMVVLAPNMPESGLVDACCQVKQAAISAADNCEVLEEKCASLLSTVAQIAQEMQNVSDRCRRHGEKDAADWLFEYANKLSVIGSGK